MKRLYPVTCFSVMLLLSSVAATAELLRLKMSLTNLSTGFSHYLYENAAQSEVLNLPLRNPNSHLLPDGVPNLGLSSDEHWFLFARQE